MSLTDTKISDLRKSHLENWEYRTSKYGAIGEEAKPRDLRAELKLFFDKYLENVSFKVPKYKTIKDEEE